MSTSTDWAANGAAFSQQATDATKAAVESVTKTATRASAKATKAAVDNATTAIETATKAVKSANENTASKAAEATSPAVEAAGAKLQEIVDTLTAQAKQAGNTWLDAYDQGFAAFLELRGTLAAATKVDAVIELAATNSKALEQLNAAYVSALRDLLK